MRTKRNFLLITSVRALVSSCTLLTLFFVMGLALLSVLLIWRSDPAAAISKHPSLNLAEAPKQHLLQSYGKLPLSFEANRGQSDARVKFLSHGRGYTLFLTPTEAVLALAAPAKPKPSHRYSEPLPPSLARIRFPEALTVNGHGNLLERAMTSAGAVPPSVVRIKLVGANPEPKVEGIDPLPGKSNYFIGNDPKTWRTNVPNYARVRYRNVYAGVDLIYYGNQRQLEHDFVVAPGADPRAITLALEGTDKVSIGADGDLVLDTDAGEVRLQKPVVYQVAGGRQEIAAWYRLEDNNQLSFEVAAYDSTKPLVIDPALSYSTYLGGSTGDFGFGIAVDSSGNAYVTGFTESTNFPGASSSPIQSTHNCGGFLDVFVAKLNPAGSALVYSTYLGGNGNGFDLGVGIAVDSSGNAYVTGFTESANFPTVNPIQSTFGGSGDAFVAKLNAAGSALVYSTYLGGNSHDEGVGIAVDSSGNAYVTGETGSTNFPTANPFQPALSGVGDAFVAKLNAAGSLLVYSTYLGGSGHEAGHGIAVDSSGNAYVTGFTASTNFPTANPIQSTNGGFGDAFVAKLNAAGSALVYSTYLGGNSHDEGVGIAVDSSGNAYVTGVTFSTNFPTANPIQSTLGGDAFVTKINPKGPIDLPVQINQFFHSFSERARRI